MHLIVNERRLPRVQLLGSLTVVLLLVLSLGAYFIHQHRLEFEARLETLEKDQIQEYQNLLVQQVESAKNYLEFVRSRTETVLKAEIKAEVDQALSIAEVIYNREHGRRSEAEVKQLIVEALRPIRFLDGRGYFFIDDIDGMCVLLPTSPEREGSTLRDNRDDQGHYIMRGLIQAARMPVGTGFSRYRWYLPGNNTEMTDKISYVRLFEPFNWIIGTGEYLGSAEAALQREALDRLRTIRFGESGYIAAIRTDGLILVSPTAPESEGKRYTDLTVEIQKSAVENLLRVARGGGGFLRYSWFRPGSRQPAPKLAYVSTVERWGWLLVAGIYLDDLEATVQARHAELEQSVNERMRATLLILLAALAIASALSLLFSKWIKRLIKGYKADIERRKAVLRQTAKDLYLTKFVVDHAADMVFLADEAGRIAYVNQGACLRLGRAAEKMVGHSSTLVDPAAIDSADGIDAGRIDSSRIDGGGLRFETELADAAGDRFPVEVMANQMVYDGVIYYCAIARDVSQRKSTERELRLAARVFESVSEAIMVTDGANRILAVNAAFTTVTGYRRDDVIDRDPKFLSAGQHNDDYYREMWTSLENRGHWSGEIFERRRDGTVFPAWLSIRVVRDDTGTITHYIGALSDITDRKASEAQIRRLAEYDFLTDLPNRMLFRDRLDRALAMAERLDRRLAVMFLDLDHFKNINDSLGHALGDQLLREVAVRLGAQVRTSDTVSRQGGDEFVILLPELEEPEQAAGVAEKLLTAISAPFHIQGSELRITPSIGISIYPDDGRDLDTLLSNADTAMYNAKSTGRNTYKFFTREMNARVIERLRLENDLRRALEQEELELYYQPQFSIDGTVLVGCEALMRWRHPKLGWIPPGKFIPVAEECGLILRLSDWVLNEACRQGQEWHRQGLPRIPIAVNLSAVQFRHSNLPEKVAVVLRRSGLPPEYLELEVTESALMEGVEQVLQDLQALKQMGVTLAIDDFGTGYSSLSYLKRFAIDKLKIDQSFVQDLPNGRDDAAIVTAIIGMAKSLGLRTIAEGVETDAQRRLLETLGCDEIQGYLLGVPASAERMAAILAAHATETAELPARPPIRLLPAEA